jgi:hypothetical protein
MTPSSRQKPSADAIRSLKSLVRDNDSREFYKHEVRALGELYERGWLEFDDGDQAHVLTQKAYRYHKKHLQGTNR